MTEKKENIGKMPSKIKNSVQAVVDNKICCGCGSCYVVCPQRSIEFTYGKRYNYPHVNLETCTACGLCLKVCPSAFLLKGTDPGFPNLTERKDNHCYLTHSPDDGIRLDSSSGGFITALILHLMKKGQVDGAIVTSTEGENPWIAKSVIAMNREELLGARASKYAPVSNCVALKDVLERPGRYVFVGMPCMVEGLRKIQQIKPQLKEKIVLAVGMVCAGMASRQSTLAFLKRHQVDIDKAWKIAYRGGGWPGYFRVFDKEGNVLLKQPLLGGSLDLVVPGDHYLRCWNCLDQWGRFSDIVVSDPWCDEMVDNETKGWSGIMIMTPSGQQAVDSAVAAGDITAKEISPDQMYDYNKHIIITKDHPRHAWMALFQLIFFGRFRGLSHVFRCVLRRKGIGLKTTLRARFDKNYYENENVIERLLKVQPGGTEHLRKRSEIAHMKYQSKHTT